MASAEALKMMAELRANRKPDRPLAQARAEWDIEAAAQALPAETVVEPGQMGGVASEWIVCGPVIERGVVLLLHGGGYHAGGLVTHRAFAARVSRALGRRVLQIAYALAPEHPFPAGLHDALAAYKALIAEGVVPGEIVLLGDSAGGGLAISLMLALKRDGDPQPAGAVLLSPWTDLECSGTSYRTNLSRDPNMSREDLLAAADDYRGSLPASEPMLSPIHADLSGLPPMLVQAGGGEIMLDDSIFFAEQARTTGCRVTLDVTPDLWHVFQNGPDDIPEVRAAFDRMGTFVAGVMARPSAP